MARSRGETRTCISVLDRSSGALTEIYERGAQAGRDEWEALEAIVRAELERGDIGALALSGSLPPGAPSDGYGRIVRIARDGSRHVPVFADTYGSALAAVLTERPDVVKVNAAEAGDATGLAVSDVQSAAEAAAALRTAGAAAAIVTIGREGAVVASAGEHRHLVPPDIRGAYPVGSGDAFFGGLVVALDRGQSVIEAARLGLAAGIANAQIPGAGELDPADIDRILKGISLGSVSDRGRPARAGCRACCRGNRG